MNSLRRVSAFEPSFLRPMEIAMTSVRPLGTMITYGFRQGLLDVDLEIARWLEATHLEILPDWGEFPDASALRRRLDAEGFVLWSAHGAWGSRTVEADRIDLADLDASARRQSLDDLRRCLDWVKTAGGRCLVVHPGGLSSPTDSSRRRDALTNSLVELNALARQADLIVAVENMPPRVWPGTRTRDLTAILREIGGSNLAVAIDTGHAQLVSSPVEETQAAGELLFTTHVHDNDGRRDSHLPPGLGSIDWEPWIEALDAVGYEGPIMLECIRHLRERPESRTDSLMDLLRRLTVSPKT